MSEHPPPTSHGHASVRRLVLAHLRAGWLGLALYAALGIALEALLAFELPTYVDAAHEQRRSLLRLGHAHGTLLSLLQLAFAWTLERLGTASLDRAARLASLGLGVGLGLVPLGFLWGGLDASPSDPGPLVLLVPLGALGLLVGLIACAWLVHRRVGPREPGD